MKRGQILLITVMILATVLTVVLSVSFKSITETKISKLEEENQKALAAAEAAIQEALKTGSASFGAGGLTDFGSFTGGAEIITTTTNSFTTPIVSKDSSYTFYLSQYDPETKNFSGGSINEDIEVCFNFSTTNPAVEITLVKTDSIFKYPIDPNKGESGRMSNSVYSPSTICSSDSSFSYSYTIPGADIGVNGRLLIVRTLYQATKIHFHRNSNFPLQGKTVSSSVVANNTGVSKKITLFQTYPQIPAEFFNTTF